MNHRFAEILMKYRGHLIACYLLLMLYFAYISPAPLQFLGLIPVFIGALIRIVSGMYIHQMTRSTQFYADRLYQSGFYSLTRNPLYLSNVITSVGFIWMLNLNWVVSIFFTALIWIHHEIIIRIEEMFLKKKFPSEYQLYSEQVPRWLRVSVIPKKIDWKPQINFMQSLKYQTPNLTRTVLVLLLILSIHHVESL